MIIFQLLIFFLHMWNHVTLQEFWNHVIYQLFKYACALLMKKPVLTCLKTFVSNTLFTSSLKKIKYIYFILFLIWNIIGFLYRKKYWGYKQIKIIICLVIYFVAKNKSFQVKNMITYIKICCHFFHLLPICFVIFTIKVKVVIIFVFFTHLTVTIIYYYLIQSFFHYKFN
jgi:hypothetical protein